jgi:CHASE2 domain-containing sensor protein
MIKRVRLRDIFFKKNGQYSKTAIFLSLATIILLILWPIQSLCVGLVIYGWTIPAFNSGSAGAVMTILSTLYVVNKSKLVREQEKDDTKID